MSETFPILQSLSNDERKRRVTMGCPKAIPWDMIAPHERQAERNHYQTLKRLAERGGLSPAEAVAVLEDRPWRSMPAGEAIERLKELLAAYQPASA